MFIDQVKIYVKAGDGGHGAATFRREKYVPRGGPSGGDGGKGGDIILEVSPHENTLLSLRYKKHHRAENGEPGAASKRYGRGGKDYTIPVPPGTIVFDDDSNLPYADLTEPGQVFTVAKGGRGGRGNARFATSTLQAPTFAEQGEPGEERNLRLELKLLADAGLVGFPNVGKSTLLAHVSAARPKIADYPFTTLVPNLGVVEVDGQTFVIADIPGLIEGAHMGKGLGHAFLRHIERTRVIVHVLDAAGIEGRDPFADFEAINYELARYAPDLASRPQVVALNKIDLLPAGDEVAALTAKLLQSGHRVYPISAVTGQGLREMLRATVDLLATTPPPAPIKIEKIPLAEQGLQVKRDHDGTFVVVGRQVERRVAMTDLNNEDALLRLQLTLRDLGVFSLLREAGVEEGDTVRIKDWEFDWQE